MDINIKPVIENRMHRASTHFNLLSIQKSRSKLLQEELEENADINQRNEILSKLSAHQSLRESQRLENERRRYNYIPFILKLLKELAKKHKLRGMLP